MAVIKVGAATETEMKEKKARVEDAMHATKAAVEEGIVPGGGVALIRAAKVLDGLKLDGDQQIGVNIVARAIEEPMRWIATNAGHEGSIVVQKVREMKDEEGFNALTDTYENLVQGRRHRPGQGRALRRCRTPRPSPRSCSRRKRSSREIPEEKKDAPAMPGGGGMGGMSLSRKSTVDEVRSQEVQTRKARWLTPPGLFHFRSASQWSTRARGFARAAGLVYAQRCYRSVNVNSMVICTGTAEPMRVPGAKRHCRAALMASWSRPNTESSDRRT